jgi:hypothetical protein
VAEFIFWFVVLSGFATVVLFSVKRPSRQPRQMSFAMANNSLAHPSDHFDTAAFADVSLGEQEIMRTGWLRGSLIASGLSANRTDSPSVRGNKLSSSEIDDLIELCETSPKEGLARIEQLDPQTRRQPAVMFARVVAYRRLICGPESEFLSKYGNDFDAFLQSLDKEKLNYAKQALKQIREIELAVANFFTDDEWRESVVNIICIVAEHFEPAIVHNMLGWTKLIFFGDARLFVLRERLPEAERLHEVPEEVMVKLLSIRFSCNRIVRSALALSARQSSRSGWTVLFALFPVVSLPKSGNLRRAVIGFLMLCENGKWKCERP